MSSSLTALSINFRLVSSTTKIFHCRNNHQLSSSTPGADVKESSGGELPYLVASRITN